MKATRLIWSTALFAVLFVLVAHTTAAAQQAVAAAQQTPDPTRVTVPASSAGVSSPSALPGPRLQPEWQSLRPAFADSSASSAPVAGSNTITISTVVLVLAVIILVLLIVK
jgi:disulfide bond formation protein DsbB